MHRDAMQWNLPQIQPILCKCHMWCIVLRLACTKSLFSFPFLPWPLVSLLRIHVEKQTQRQTSTDRNTLNPDKFCIFLGIYRRCCDIYAVKKDPKSNLQIMQGNKIVSFFLNSFSGKEFFFLIFSLELFFFPFFPLEKIIFSFFLAAGNNYSFFKCPIMSSFVQYCQMNIDDFLDKFGQMSRNVQ